MRRPRWRFRNHRKGANKVSRHKGDVPLRIVPALRKITRTGAVVSSEPDAKGNADVVAWHTIAATVTLDGQPRAVIVKVKEARDGKFHYDLSRDMSDGARHLRASGLGQANAAGLEDNPVKVDIAFGGMVDNLSVLTTGRRGLSDVVGQTLRARGLDRAVSPKVVRTLLSTSGVPVLGSYRGGEIKVNAGAADPGHVVRQEIIHAPRDANLWGPPHGLFTGTEWRALVRAARADEGIRRAVERAYVIWTPSGRPRKWWPSSMRTGRPTAPSIRPGRSCAHWSASTPFSARWGRPCGARASLTRQW
ncbi:MAG: hypothetical protein WAK98_17075 [Gemmobacter sp.]